MDRVPQVPILGPGRSMLSTLLLRVPKNLWHLIDEWPTLSTDINTGVLHPCLSLLVIRVGIHAARTNSFRGASVNFLDSPQAGNKPPANRRHDRCVR
jgi:hypothetical protein